MIFLYRAESASTGAPITLGEEEGEDEDGPPLSASMLAILSLRSFWHSRFRGPGVLEAWDAAPGQFPSILGIGNPFADADGGGRNGPHLVWTSGRWGTITVCLRP